MQKEVNLVTFGSVHGTVHEGSEKISIRLKIQSACIVVRSGQLVVKAALIVAINIKLVLPGTV